MNNKKLLFFTSSTTCYVGPEIVLSTYYIFGSVLIYTTLAYLHSLKQKSVKLCFNFQAANKLTFQVQSLTQEKLKKYFHFMSKTCQNFHQRKQTEKLTKIPDQIPWAPFPYAVQTNPATAQPSPQAIRINPIRPAPIAIFFDRLPVAILRNLTSRKLTTWEINWRRSC